MDNKALITAESIHIAYKSRRRKFFAVRGVSFSIGKGETLGLVGESGCGKTTLGKGLVKLLPIERGTLTVSDENRPDLQGRALRNKRSMVQMVFQNPYGSLNPRMTIGAILREPLQISGITRRSEQRENIVRLLNQVGIDPSFISKYPHEFSGGQCQRIAIARALAARPSVIIADEPVSSLDVSVQAQVLNLFTDLKREQLSMLFISHDLSVVKYISDRIAVMYRGVIVESAEKEELFLNPLHPYTQLLLSSVPDIETSVPPTTDDFPVSIKITGSATQGCVFCDRCPDAQPQCRKSLPPPSNLSKPDSEHIVCCFKYSHR